MAVGGISQLPCAEVPYMLGALDRGEPGPTIAVVRSASVLPSAVRTAWALPRVG
jgi:hypothetical protein